MSIAELERFPVTLVCAAMDASLACAGGMRGVDATSAPMVRRWTLTEVPPCFDSAKEWRGWSAKNEETAHPERWRGLPCVDCVGQAEMIALGRCGNAHLQLPLLDVDDAELPSPAITVSVALALVGASATPVPGATRGARVAA